MNKVEHLKFIIERFDHYYDGVNSKGSFYIGLNTFIFGGICVAFIDLHDKIQQAPSLWLLSAFLLIFCILSVCFTLRALMPFLKNSQQKFDSPSLLYFGGIAQHQLSHFRDKINQMDESALTEDLLKQVHCLATGLDSKYKNLKRAGFFVAAQFIIMLPLLFLVIKKLTVS